MPTIANLIAATDLKLADTKLSIATLKDDLQRVSRQLAQAEQRFQELKARAVMLKQLDKEG